jgi:hypothetical protein
MRRFVCVALFLLLSVPGWSAAKKITIAELQAMLQSMHRDNKADADVATALKQIQLSEQLTRPVMNSLGEYIPGQQSTEQLYVLEARSATQPPPAADIPTTAPLNAAAQQALLAKAAAYASSTYSQLPSLTALRTTQRFQDNVEVIAESSGMQGSAKDAATASAAANAFHYVRYIGATDTDVTLEHGVERLPEDKTRWGANRMIAIMEPYPALLQVFQEATDAGAIKWERWETVETKPVAVFSFQVPKKKAHVSMNVCCFPEIDQTGKATFSSAALGRGGATGNLRTDTDWHPYKQNNVPYHGELFIDPESGVVVRMITAMEPKHSDVVHQQDTRTDYGTVMVGDKSLIVPVKTVAITEVVPNGDSGAGGFSTRCTLFNSEYKNYQLAGK